MSWQPEHPDRRRFLTTAAASAFVLAAHRILTWAEVPAARKHSVYRANPRILGLRLKTAASLEGMKAFYGGTLGLPILERSRNAITVGAGRTPITFAKTGSSDDRDPFYHFAFNIPENKVRQAYDWQRERTELIPSLPNLRDPSYPKNVIHFRHWNAHSVFFFDPAGNVVEYIGRHDLPNATDGPFKTADILYVSEIAFVVDDVPATAKRIELEFEVPQYGGASEAFHAVGDEEGLLLVFRRGRRLGLGSDRPREADVFPTEASIRAVTKTLHRVAAFPYEISSRPALT